MNYMNYMTNFFSEFFSNNTYSINYMNYRGCSCLDPKLRRLHELHEIHDLFFFLILKSPELHKLHELQRGALGVNHIL